MANLKAIRKRITSVKNTKKVTKAMQMIAAARLRKAQRRTLNARAYEEHAKALALHIAQRSGRSSHPYLRTSTDVKRVEYLVLTSDRGLCGGFNENLLRGVMARWREDEVKGITVSATVVGRKGRDFFRARQRALRQELVGFYEDISVAKLRPMIEELAARYLSGEIDQVVLIYNRFRSALAQDVITDSILPMIVVEKEYPPAVDYIYEPSRQEVIDRLLERALATRVYHACLESMASELAARMTAMDSATKNANEMIDGLTMKYNRARQASITMELLDLVNGAEALKG